MKPHGISGVDKSDGHFNSMALPALERAPSCC
jgi:hypothetical protein